MPDSVLDELAAELASIAASEENARRRELWLRHFAGERQRKAPVKCSIYTGSQDKVWDRLLPASRIVHRDGLANSLELQLRHRIWKFREIPDDGYVFPTVWVNGRSRPASRDAWGMPIRERRTDDPGGSYKEIAPLVDEGDLAKLAYPEPEPHPEDDAALVAEARGLTGGRLSVKTRYDGMGAHPYEVAVRLRGAEQLLYDVYDRPEFVHRLMDHVTEGLVRYHARREALGMVDAEEPLRWHQPYDSMPAGLERKLKGCWVYVSAQSAASLSPEMYAEFVHRYNARLARLFWKVYYHGCEDLARKAEVIRELPNLVHFHVSPWTSLEAVRPFLEGRGLVLEVHSHPANVLFAFGESEIREELRRLARDAAWAPFDLNLCDVQDIPDAGERLKLWTACAREASEMVR
jgi:hypothetical protein